MAIIMIMAFTILVMWGALVFSYGRGSIENGKYLLGITLPKQYRDETEVKTVLKSYRVGNRKLNWIGLFSGAALLLFSDYMSIQFPLLMIWFFLLLWFYQENVKKHACRLYEVKKKNGWLTGNPHIVRVDTVLSSIKDRGCVSWLWFLPAWLMGMIARSYIEIFIFVQMLFFLGWLGVCKSRPVVYCSDTKMNQKIDRALRFEWSRCMVLHGYGMSILMLFIGWTGRLQDSSAGVILGVFLATLGSFIAIFFAWYNGKKVKERVLECLTAADTKLYDDDDEYWLNGYPTGMSPAGLAEKRIGIGWTTTHSLTYSTTDKAVGIIIGLFCIGITILMIPFDFAKVTMQIDNEAGKCRIEAASMGYIFELEDVENVSWVEERPSMSKRNGLDSNRFYLGDFRVSGYGNCKVFLSQKNDIAILVELKDKNIWFNSECFEETETFYQALREAVGM